MTFRTELHAFVDRIADELDAIRSQPGVEFRTSGPRATGVSRKLHNVTCRSGRVQGAYRDGREWVCTREAWFAARRSKPTSFDCKGAGEAAPANDAASAFDVDAAIASAGYRLTRGAR